MATTSSFDMARSRFSPCNIGSLTGYSERLPPGACLPKGECFPCRLSPHSEVSFRRLTTGSSVLPSCLLTAETLQDLKPFPTPWADNQLLSYPRLGDDGLSDSGLAKCPHTTYYVCHNTHLVSSM